MLRGTIKYNDFVYSVFGVDTASTLNLRLSSQNYSAICLMSNSGMEELGNELWERGLNIGMAKVTVETHNYKDETTGRNLKMPINQELFCRLGALLRYMKNHCYTRNMDGFTGMMLASGEFEPEELLTYNIPFEDDTSKYIGSVKLRLGNIFDLTAKTDLFEIELHNDPMLDGQIMPVFKNGVSKGFANTEEYLGFKVVVQKSISTTLMGGMYKDLASVIEAHPEKEFEYLRGKDYRIVTDETLDEICDYIYNYDGYVYYDTETTGLNINFKSRIGQADQCVGIILSVKDGESFFFPMQMKAIKNLCGGDHFYFMERYIRRILEQKELVAHNMSFDWKVAYIYDINANIVHDTMALFKLTLGNEDEDLKVGLKELTKMFLGRDALELSDLVVNDSWGESDIKFWDLTEELVKLYACADTDNTRGLMQFATHNDLLTKYNAHKVYEIEIAFSYAVAYQEFYGHLFDINKVGTLHTEIMEELERLYKQMCSIIGHDFNPNSSPQLLKILYQELGIPAQISRKTGRPTTDKDTLKKLGDLTDIDGKTKYPFVKLLLEYRVNEGVRKIIDQFPELSTQDGYLFPGVQQYGTRTGRVSIKTPNYQSYNNAVKKNIIPRPGYYMFDTDYSSVEYRVLGNMSGNKMIKENFYDPDFDYHTYQAARMYGVPYSSVTSKLRKAAKGINFGLPYGMGDESLGIRIFGEKSDENTRKAAFLRKSYFKGQEDIQVFFDNARERGAQNGYTETYFGRRRYYDRTKFTVSSIRRQAGNHVIQGCLSYETLVQTQEYGIVPIGSIVDEHLTFWDGNDWTTGFVGYSGKKRKCVVHFRGGMDMVCSPDHKFLVRSNKGNERFVKCKDLLTKELSKNPHRVVVNTNFTEECDTFYESEIIGDDFGISRNANNVHLDMVENDFVLGQILGRLASDGSCDFNNYRVIQMVAEHELDVYEFLKDAMSAFNCNAEIKHLRDDRNERMGIISVYSKTLSREIQRLDIRHKIHEKIFGSPSMLRGFIRGMFDGDGGISGKTITLVQGTQDDFSQLLKDIQKALLFFGIRSYYREYDERKVLTIRTHDNQKFLDTIGFINEDKQNKGRELYTNEDEHVFGSCLVVDSIDFLDEYIDMYDVCNTERGYFVADGVVTHNSAADIYKLAVGRVFKMICKRGWLGKVILTGFIHDELLGEVSTDIDPMVWLKALREEFEVKITDENGDPWCPLYMGFGWGRNWYEAKSTEIPIKLQWEFVEKYGTKGFPAWTGDVAKFCDAIPDILRAFRIEDCARQLLAEDHQGKEIKPALNSEILGVLDEDRDLYPKVLENEDLRETYHIKGSIVDSEGNIITSVPKTSDTQEAITYFCMLHNVDRSKVDIKSISDVEVKQSAQALDYGDESEGYEDEYEKLKKQKEDMITARIQMLGMYADFDNKTVTCLLLPNDWLNLIKSHTVPLDKAVNAYKLMFIDYKNQKMYETMVAIPSSEISAVQAIYTRYLSMVNRG